MLEKTVLTTIVPTLTEFGFHLSIGPFTGQLAELVCHGGSGDDGLEAALAFGHVLLRVQDNDVDFGHVKHPQRHGRTQAQRDGQCGCLNVHLE